VTVRVELPAPLRSIANVEGEQRFVVDAPVTIGRVLDAIEARHPTLRGTIRDQQSGKRRAFIRFFACAQDLSHQPTDTPLPEAVERGEEPFLVVGAIAGG
jgi:hypothetical protein